MQKFPFKNLKSMTIHTTEKTKGEFSLINKITSTLGPPGNRVIMGIGDDSAVVVAPAENLLLCSDCMVEGIHFDLSYTSAADLGHKALASCLSDLAAMNGHPLYALVSIAMPEKLTAHFVEEFYSSAKKLGKSFEFDIVGGDLSSSPSSLFIDVMCVGKTPHPILRKTAKVGDWLAVSGTPGASAAGLYALQNQPRHLVPNELAQAHLRPVPRFDLLPDLATFCTSLIDVSDGISSEAIHIGEASGVGIEIDLAKIPLHPESIRLSPSNSIQWALHGGEDYELLATLDAEKVAKAGAPPKGFTIIGQVIPSGYRFKNQDGSVTTFEAGGFNHFGSS